jgi:hypothetical protein
MPLSIKPNHVGVFKGKTNIGIINCVPYLKANGLGVCENVALNMQDK